MSGHHSEATVEKRVTLLTSNSPSDQCVCSLADSISTSHTGSLNRLGSSYVGSNLPGGPNRAGPSKTHIRGPTCQCLAGRGTRVKEGLVIGNYLSKLYNQFEP